ncbi:amidohydrolase [Polynucleobacter sp. JS-Polo-80-F4]|uniref:amidohydrolase family protein n=1 Tax=Polynucleobacter sp. JS-Polo-80-F4 TaxID=2576918 RepID=UPI001C0C7A2F|nr:amidohydrolase family protein [Polynucleobacter sp. JS-Polo-80-F4]MBU3616384.1 amidohydrolase family protein [Polynucleobacter sp. JS-Polo-80-F4]
MSYATIFPMNVDAHFHVFNNRLIDEAQARYSVNYSASIDDWLKVANKQQISRGIVVQPSFLGFDNSLLLETIKQNPERLRGVAVVDPNTPRNELLELKQQGVRGIRLNLYGDQDPFGTIQKYGGVIHFLKGLNMHLQIHHDDGLLNDVLLALPGGIKIVIDHFGRPLVNDEFEKQSDGINKHQSNLWIKLSAQYRTAKLNHQALFEYWLKKIGVSKLLWGSDWPHTRFETTQTYEAQMKEFVCLSNSAELRKKILSSNPVSLYWAE